MRRWGVALLTCVLAAAVSGCTDQKPPPPSPVFPVAVALTSTEQLSQTGITIGVLAPPMAGPGQEYRDTINGAKVAAFRFQLGGLNVTIKTVAEDGTPEGATTAMQTLIGYQPTGIIVASTGAHLAEALTTASKAGIATLLPYDYAAPLTAPAYRTGPNTAAIATAISATITKAGINHPTVITEPGYTVNTEWPTSIAYQGDPVAAAQSVADAVTAGQTDGVIIEASANTQALIVTRIQSLMGSRQLPIVLTPQAVTPTFAAGVANTAALQGVLMAVGQNTSDATGLQANSQGENTTAFLQAVRMASDNPKVTNIFGDGPFAAASTKADVASHDAVIAIVRAAEKAGTTNPAFVTAAFAGLTLDATAGLVGAPLNFATPSALSADALVTLYASPQPTGTRPSATTNTITWLALG